MKTTQNRTWSFPPTVEANLEIKSFVSVLLTTWLTVCLPLLTDLLTVPLTFLQQERLRAAQPLQYDSYYLSEISPVLGLCTDFPKIDVKGF